jgi:hypothetical protein
MFVDRDISSFFLFKRKINYRHLFSIPSYTAQLNFILQV